MSTVPGSDDSRPKKRWYGDPQLVSKIMAGIGIVIIMFPIIFSVSTFTAQREFSGPTPMEPDVEEEEGPVPEEGGEDSAEEEGPVPEEGGEDSADDPIILEPFAPDADLAPAAPSDTDSGLASGGAEIEFLLVFFISAIVGSIFIIFGVYMHYKRRSRSGIKTAG